MGHKPDYYKNHKEECIKATLKWIKNNKEKYNAYQREYRKTHSYPNSNTYIKREEWRQTDKAIIYAIINIITGQAYIGSTCYNLKIRIARHRAWVKRKKLPLYIDIKQYGWDKFQIIILEECNKSEARDVEQEWIEEYRAKRIKLYNQNNAKSIK